MASFFCRGQLIGSNVGEAVCNMSDADKRELLLDYIVLWDTHPSEMIASGSIFNYTRDALVREALEDVKDNGTRLGKVEYRPSGYKVAVDCGCGKSRCTHCGQCGSKNLAIQGTSNRRSSGKASTKKTSAKKTAGKKPAKAGRRN